MGKIEIEQEESNTAKMVGSDMNTQVYKEGLGNDLSKREHDEETITLTDRAKYLIQQLRDEHGYFSIKDIICDAIIVVNNLISSSEVNTINNYLPIDVLSDYADLINELNKSE